ncbi:PaaI family thioesterase [Sphingomonas sp. LHG3406-1]|uniref:PaaI family thioesterase n=1 Tax=Sphingomonas sp. LHG3406-1 TaxID=2804617 RepID=UPI002639E0E0|nr:PaaI family thioesterase [Sphingomonas sp. LHG3406-1]
MSSDDGLKLALEAANAMSPFHRVTGFAVEAAGQGEAALSFDARPELLNHAGALHAGVQCAALDTAAGYAAATIAGPVVTLQFSTQFLSSARGERFEASATVTRAGKAQLFVDARLFAFRDGERRLVASASAVLTKAG